MTVGLLPLTQGDGMPARKRGAEEVPAAEAIAELQDERTLEAATTAREFFAKFQGEKDVRVPTYRQNNETGRWEYVKSLSPDLADEDYLRRTFGPGLYKMIARGPKSEQYPQGYYGTHMVSIADIGEPRAAVPVASAENGSDALKMVLAMQMQHSAMLEKMVFALLAGKAQDNGGADPTKMLSLATTIAEKMSAGHKDFNPQDYLSQLLSFYDKGFERGQDNGASREPGYMDIVRDLGKPIVELMARASQVPPGIPAVDAPAALPIPQPPAREVQVMKGPQWLNAITPYFPTLASLAQLDMAPDAVADMVLDKLPEDVLDKIRGDSIAPNWENEIADVLPDIFRVRFRAWTVRVLHEIKEGLTEDAPPPIVGAPEEELTDEPSDT